MGVVVAVDISIDSSVVESSPISVATRQLLPSGCSFSSVIIRTDQVRRLCSMPELQICQQAPLDYEEAGMVLKGFSRVHELDIEPPDKLWQDLVHFKEGEMSSDTKVGTTTKLDKKKFM